MNGKSHDFLSIVGSVVTFGAVTSLAYTAPFALPAAAGCLFGGIFLSPDLDTRSLPLKRWLIFKFVWVIYHELMPHEGGRHRSWVSHTPIISSQLRLAYLSIITAGIFPTLVHRLFRVDVGQQFNLPLGLMAFAVGVEIAAALHLIADGMYCQFYFWLVVILGGGSWLVFQVL